jgi:type VI protein secretion system component Hcp
MKLLIISILLAAQTAVAQVGIGTTNPSSNSVLDLTSPNKGLLLPRVNDTSVVNNPSAGLMIYDVSKHTPAFHNGTNWSSLAGAMTMSASNGDSITYTISGPNSFVPGNYKVLSMSYGGSNPGTTISQTYMQDVHISKDRDINSVHFFSNMISAQLNGLIEFKMYVPGAATPYYSVKLTNWRISSVQQGLGGGGGVTDQISFLPGTIGFKDWINNISFSYNLTTNIIGTY